MDVQQLFTALKTKYPQSGLSDNEIKGLATSLFATGLVTDENVSAIVDAQADSMKGFQSLFDSRFNTQKESFKKTFETDLEKTFREKYHINAEGKQEVVKPDEPDALAAAIAKALDEKLKPISDRLAQEDERRAAQTRTEEIIAKAKANGISEDLAKMLNVPSDVTDLDSFFKDKAQQLVNLGFQPSTPPSEGGEAKTDGKAIADQIRAGAPKEAK